MGRENAFESVDVEDEATFAVVETTQQKPQGGNRRKQFAPKRQWGQTGRNREVNDEDRNSAVAPSRGGWASGQSKGAQQRQKVGKKNFRRFWRDDRPERTRDWSVVIAADWTLQREITFAQLGKLNSEVPKGPETLHEAGKILPYKRALDRTATKSAKKVIDYAETSFYKVTASSDPVLQKLAKAGEGNVFTTDSVMTAIMAAARSANSWDVIITKKGDKVWLDKRDGSSFDYLTVSETCLDVLPEEDENINSAFSLSREATMLDENFSQQVLDKNGEAVEFENPNPFATSDESPAPKCFRYRRWKTDDGLSIVVRTEVDAYTEVGGNRKMLAVHACNEFDPKISNIDWRRKIDSQRGAVLANEMKSNNCKMSKWVMAAELAGADALQLGFVSRLNPKNAKSHQLLASQLYNTDYVAKSLNVDMNNAWGVVRAILDVVREKGDGKYVILKDPSKASLRIYETPSS